MCGEIDIKVRAMVADENTKAASQLTEEWLHEFPNHSFNRTSSGDDLIILITRTVTHTRGHSSTKLPCCSAEMAWYRRSSYVRGLSIVYTSMSIKSREDQRRVSKKASHTRQPSELPMRIGAMYRSPLSCDLRSLMWKLRGSADFGGAQIWSRL